MKVNGIDTMFVKNFNDSNDSTVPSTKVLYKRPKTRNDLKRNGRSLTIKTDAYSLVLNGSQINSLKRVLEEAGEVKISDKWRKQL